MDIFVGIDPSLNSTGICCLVYDGQNKIKERFYIIKPNKLTRKEQSIHDDYENYPDFDYILYDKTELKCINDNHKHEWEKTQNFRNALSKIIQSIKEECYDYDNVYIVQEGISYGSTIRTKSVFDLAGLNYMLRDRLIKLCTNRYESYRITIAPPTEIKKFATGSGNCKKEALIENFKILFPKYLNLPKIDDICDAYYMALFAKYLKDKEDEAQG